MKGAAQIAMNAGMSHLAVALTAAKTQGIVGWVRHGASKFLAQHASLWKSKCVDFLMPTEAFIYQLLGREGFRDVKLLFLD